MDESNLYQSLGQVSVGEAVEIFRDHLRGCVREMICEVMAAEVTALCGPKHCIFSTASGGVFGLIGRGRAFRIGVGSGRESRRRR